MKFSNCNLSKVIKIIPVIFLAIILMQFVSAGAMVAWADVPNITPMSIEWDNGWTNEQSAIQLPASPYNTAQSPKWIDIESAGNQVVMLVTAEMYSQNGERFYARIWEGGQWSSPEFLGGTAGVSLGKVQTLESFDEKVMAVYSDASKAPKYRIWNGNSWEVEKSARALSGAPYWMELKKDENSDNMVLVALDYNRKVYAQVWDGNSWEDLIELETKSNVYGSVDVEYDSCGRAIVVWSDAVSRQIQYRRWNGDSWSAEGNTVNLAASEGAFDWIQLASNPNSDEMVLVGRKQNGKIYAQLWNGNSWTKSWDLGNSGNFGAKTIDAEYDSCGRAIVAWVEAKEKVTRYAVIENELIIDDGSTSNEAGRAASWIELAADPNSNEMILTETISRPLPARGQGSVYAQVWDGNSWTSSSYVQLEDVYSFLSVGNVDVEYIGEYNPHDPILINIISPEDRRYNYTLIDFNITTQNAERCWLTVDSGSENEMVRLNESDFYYMLDLTEESHNVVFRCEDIQGNENSESRNFEIDLTAPEFVNFWEVPASPANYLPGQVYEFSTLTNNPDVDSAWYIFGNATNIADRINNTYTFSQIDLAVGNYNLVWCLNDTAGNSNCFLRDYIVEKGVMPLNLYINGNDSDANFAYGSILNIAGTKRCSEGSLSLYRNGILVSNPDFPILGAGNYNYTLVFLETENFTSGNLTRFLEVFRGVPNLTMNSVPGWTAGYGTQTTITGNCPAGLTCNLYRDGALVSNPDAEVLGMGNYNYVFNTSGNENYTSAEISNVLSITRGAPSLSITSSAGWNTGYSVPTTLDGVGCPLIGAGDISCRLFVDNVEITNPATLTLGVGSYAVIFNSTEGQNYSSDSVANTLIVNKSPGAVWLFLNGVRANLTVEKGEMFDINASRILGEGSIQLYLDGSLINSGIDVYNQTYFNSTGIYNITAVYPGTQNYTADSETWFVEVTPVQSTLNLTLNNLAGSITTNINKNVNLTSFALIPVNGNVELYEDSNLIANETYIGLIRNYTTVGIINITAVYPGNLDYLPSSLTYFINVINDTTAPNISLISPAEGYATTNTGIIFSYNVSDELEINSCTLHLNNVSYQTLTGILKDVLQTFSTTLTPASYTWRVSCIDSAGNIGNSETRNLIINSESNGGGNNNNGGGSSGGGIYVSDGKSFSKNETKKSGDGVIYVNESTEQVSRGFFDIFGNWIWAILGLIILIIVIILLYFLKKRGQI